MVIIVTTMAAKIAKRISDADLRRCAEHQSYLKRLNDFGVFSFLLRSGKLFHTCQMQEAWIARKLMIIQSFY